MTRYSGPAFQEHRQANRLIPLLCLFIPLFVTWDYYNCVRLWTGLNTQFPTFEPLLNHISCLKEGEKVSLVLFPRKARVLKSLSPGTAPAGCPPSSRPVPSPISAAQPALSFFHMHPCPKQTPQGSPPRSLEFLGNLTYAFVLGRNMCWTVSSSAAEEKGGG